MDDYRAITPPRPEDQGSASVIKTADELHRALQRTMRMAGTTQADKASLLQAMLNIDAIRDRHRAALGYAPRRTTVLTPPMERRSA